MNNDFLKIVEKRRSIYNIGKNLSVTNDEIIDILKTALKNSPTPYNSQANRVVLLLSEDHDELWNIVMDTLKKIVPEKKFASTEEKINAFKNGYGTVLFFEDKSVTQTLQAKYPSYKDTFPNWALQASGMLQFIVWAAFSERDLGSTLQHYNPLIDNSVKVYWNLPQEWSLISQMPFGNILEEADEKTFEPFDKTFRVFR